MIGWFATRDDFTLQRTSSSSGGSSDTTQLVLVAIVAIGVVAGIVAAVPKLRRWVVGVVRPQIEAARENLSAIVRGEKTYQQAGRELVDAIAATANGRLTKAEAFGFSDIAVDHVCRYV